MAAFVLTNAYLTVNTVDLSDHVISLEFPLEAEMVDETAMGDSARSFLAGLKNGTVTVNFQQDFASSKVDATLFPLLGAAAFALAIRPVNTTIAATNPEFQFNALLKSYPPVAGTVGELAKAQAVFQLTTVVTRDTTP